MGNHRYKEKYALPLLQKLGRRLCYVKDSEYEYLSEKF